MALGLAMWFTALGVRFSRCDFACRVQDAKLPCWPAYTDVPDAGAEIIAKTILGFFIITVLY